MNKLPTLTTLTSLGALLLLLGGCSEGPQKPASESGPHFVEAINAQEFYKGNIHAHSSASDGNLPPAGVTSWYQSHGYHFLALTDDDRLSVDRRRDDAEFVSLGGIELAGEAAAADGKKIPVRVNAICAKAAVTGFRGVRAGKSVADTANAMIKASHDGGAVTMVDHPNLDWAIGSGDLLQLDGFELLEIASGQPRAHDAGDENHPSGEELWDTYLTQKHRIFAGGSDDARNYTGTSESDEASPGRAWLQLWAPALNERAVCDALRVGHFYVSQGPRITALVISKRTLSLSVDHWHPESDHIDFIGAGGRRLKQVFEIPARYELAGGEGYVRAHVLQGSSNKGAAPREAWTQAYFIKDE